MVVSENQTIEKAAEAMVPILQQIVRAAKRQKGAIEVAFHKAEDSE